MFFVLDDDQERLEWFKSVLGPETDTASSVGDAIPKLRANNYELAFLDHDLADSVNPDATGYQLAEVMNRENLQISTPIIIHSMNPVGADNIRRSLSRNHKNVVVVPYSVLKLRLSQRQQKDL